MRPRRDPARAPGDLSAGASVEGWPRWSAFALATYVAAVGAIVGVLGFTDLWYRFFDLTDVSLYHQYVSAMDRGLRPFVDFPAEYPPLALRLLALPGHPAGLEAYCVWFAALMFLSLGAASLLCVATARTAQLLPRAAPRAALSFACSVLALGAIVANRFDAVVALSLAAFFWALVTSRWVVAGLALGLGAALKLTPVVLAPLLLLVPAAPAARRRGALAFAAAALLPFALEGGAAGTAVESVFRYHAARPLQAESVLASPLLLAGVLGWIPVATGDAFRSQFVSAPGARALAAASGPLAAALLLVVYALAARRREELRGMPEKLSLVAAGAMLAVLVSAKVLSPQFLVWLVPVAALLSVTEPRLAALLVGSFALTQLEFPGLYWDFIELRPAAVLLVVARNATLVLAFGWTLWLLARGAPDRAARA